MLNEILIYSTIDLDRDKIEVNTLKYEFDVEINKCLNLIYILIKMDDKGITYKIYKDEILRIFNKFSIDKKIYVANSLKSINNLKEKDKVKIYE